MTCSTVTVVVSCYGELRSGKGCTRRGGVQTVLTSLSCDGRHALANNATRDYLVEPGSRCQGCWTVVGMERMAIKAPHTSVLDWSTLQLIGRGLKDMQFIDRAYQDKSTLQFRAKPCSVTPRLTWSPGTRSERAPTTPADRGLRFCYR